MTAPTGRITVIAGRAGGIQTSGARAVQVPR